MLADTTMRYLPQGYPLTVAYSCMPGRDDDQSTEQGRVAIALHAGLTDATLREGISTQPVIGWLLPADRDEPIPLTPCGVVDAIDRGRYVLVTAYGDGAVTDVEEVLKSYRDQAQRRCKELGITPSRAIA